VVLKDHTKLAELVISMIQMNEGEDKDKVIDSWDGSTSLVIKEAVNDIALGGFTKTQNGVVSL
jgi:hypothetical protein